MIQDAERFILSNRAIIEKAPLQAYASALVFSPIESLTRKCYSDQLPAWLVRRPTIQELWGNSVQTLEGHEDFVSAIAFSPDGKFLATGSWDARVRLWDRATGALHTTLQGHGERVHGIAFSRKGQLASASSRDRTVRLWEPVTGVTSRILDIKTLDTKDDIDISLPISFLPNGDLVVQDRDRSVGIWNRQNDSFFDFLLPAFTILRLLAVSSQGRLALQAYREDSNENEILLYNSTTGATQTLDVGSPAETCAAAFSLEGKLALGFYDGTIEIRDSAKGSYEKLEGHSKMIGALSFSPDGKFLVSGSEDKTLRLWELSTQTQSLIGTHSWGVNSVAFSPDGKQIASICAGSTVQIWGPFYRATIDVQEDNHEICRILFSPGGDQIACISFSDDKIRLYDTATETLQFTLVGHSDEVLEFQYSHDGNQLASRSSDYNIRLWDPRTGSERTLLNSGPPSPGRYTSWLALDFSPDGEQLASGGENNGVRIWNSKTGHLHHTLKEHLEEVSFVRFSQSGKKLASVAVDQTVRIWDTMTGALLHTFEGIVAFTTIAFSPNGVDFAWQSADNSTMLYNLETGGTRDTFTSGKSEVSAISFSADSISLACADFYGVRLWDVKNAQTMGTIPCYGFFQQLSFSTDGTYLKTERGHIQINKVPDGSSGDLSAHGDRWRCDEEWLMQGNRKMLWLPPDFRTDMVAHHDGLFALARPSGGISFFKVNQGEAVTEV